MSWKPLKIAKSTPNYLLQDNLKNHLGILIHFYFGSRPRKAKTIFMGYLVC